MHKYKHRYTNTDIQIHKYKYINTQILNNLKVWVAVDGCFGRRKAAIKKMWRRGKSCHQGGEKGLLDTQYQMSDQTKNRQGHHHIINITSILSHFRPKSNNGKRSVTRRSSAMWFFGINSQVPKKEKRRLWVEEEEPRWAPLTLMRWEKNNAKSVLSFKGNSW